MALNHPAALFPLSDFSRVLFTSFIYSSFFLAVLWRLGDVWITGEGGCNTHTDLHGDGWREMWEDGVAGLAGSSGAAL